MPIYAYKCGSCGHAKDVLQKISDVPLTDCPACGKPTFSKQLTAAGFQLKGSGWYATDFKGGSGATPAPVAGAAAAASDSASTNDSSTNANSGSTGVSSSSDSGTSSPAISAASGSCATGCACH